ncbi:MAG TPA: MMPL family transporter [Candidatus Saccharimonadales bacterium]|nr:MMPL family transporter [Candidatus Saccharimonadales bacterium]
MNSKNIKQADKEHIGFRFFAGIGRFSVRWRWLIVVVWIVGTVLAVQKLPSLASVINSNNANFLPASAPTEKALNLSSAFGTTSNTTPEPVVIATKDGKPLTSTDQTAINGLISKLKDVQRVQKVQDVGLSSDGQADELEILANVGSVDPTDFIGDLRGAISSAHLPSNLQAHLAGPDAIAVDQSKQSGNQNTQLELGSALFIIGLLLFIFRAPLAPLITFLPAVLVATLAGPIIGEIGKHGLKVSPFAEFLLTVLILGAGTDYALFLIFRVREEMQGGLASREAIVKALSRVGESITFSAATVVAALLSLLLASFEIYSDLGAPLAIGIGLMLLAGLTLLPALLAIFGRAVFWPSKRYKEPGKYGLWGRICASVVRRPVTVLVVGIIVFGGLALAVTNYKAGGFGGQTSAPSGSDSAKGTAILAKHYPQSSANPTGVLFVFPKSLWQNPAPLNKLQAEMDAAPQFKGVSGPLNSGAALTTADIKHFYSVLGASKNLPAQETAAATSQGIKPAVYQAYRSLTNYISDNGKTVQFAVGLSAGDPSTTAAMNATPDIRNKVSSIARSVGATDNGVAGEASAFYDISAISNDDLKKVIPVAIVVIGVLLGFLMRSLVAPLYLVASVALSYLAALGLTILIFINIAGNSGLVFILPLLMFLFLLALGEDYNILVMTRIREEAHGLSLRQAVTQALNTTGTTVTSAGVVLAGTFGVLAVVVGNQSSEIRDVAVGLAIGILMDTFLVRTLLVPAIVVILGRWNWWPSKHGTWVEDE